MSRILRDIYEMLIKCNSITQIPIHDKFLFWKNLVHLVSLGTKLVYIFCIVFKTKRNSFLNRPGLKRILTLHFALGLTFSKEISLSIHDKVFYLKKKKKVRKRVHLKIVLQSSDVLKLLEITTTNQLAILAITLQRVCH